MLGVNLTLWIGYSMDKVIGSPVKHFLNCEEINYCITIKCFPILKKSCFPKRNMQSAKAD